MALGPNDTISDHEKKQLDDFIVAGMKQLQEIEDIKESLKDLTKNLAEEFNCKPKVLSKVLRAAFKQTLEADKEEMEQVESALAATGRA